MVRQTLVTRLFPSRHTQDSQSRESLAANSTIYPTGLDIFPFGVFWGSLPESASPFPSPGLSSPSPVQATWQLQCGGPTSLAQARRVGGSSPIQSPQ